ncbi:hypothetical protein [Pedobacter cryoconitis]|uniref:Uncharacterized protein n=1 Tax=Pedobacter cryoconitis TaxID=188932 RepID=A0A7X0J4Y2_9SPHI|nr:hypothetical protein [Pedobacter cryoconitis]MBB6501224.1 hypothetical protein [Pedobacter cryoconitis]
MKAKNPLWQKMIDTWCTTEGMYGLTFPYIIGAERRFANRINFDIKQLLDEASNADQIYIISYCVDLEEYILGLHKPEYSPVKMLKNFGSLVINNEKLEKSQEIQSLLSFLNDMYENNINKKLVSKNYNTKEWSDFDINDIKEIEKANI